MQNIIYIYIHTHIHSELKRALKGSNVNDECCHLRSVENRLRGSLRTSWGTRILTYWHVHVQSGNTFILLIVMAQAVHATRYIYASTYVLIHSRRFANRLWLFITSLTLTDRCHLPSLPVSEPINWLCASAFQTSSRRERKR